MKKQTLLKMCAVTILLGSAGLVFAEDTGTNTAPTNKKTPVRAEIEAMRRTKAEALKNIRTNAKTDIQTLKKEAEEKMNLLREKAKAEIEMKKKEMKENGTDKINKRIDNKLEKMSARIKATIEREMSIVVRVEARIEKVKNGGGNTDEAEKLVTEAKTNLDTAKKSLADIELFAQTTTIENTATTTKEARDSLENLRTISKEVEKNLKQAHVSLVKVVGILKGLSQLNNGKNSTTTTSSN